MYYIDSDNALGSNYGDIDDAYALTAFFLSGLPLLGIGAVSGNTSACKAYENNKKLADLCNYSGPILQRDRIQAFLMDQTEAYSIIALGPLTNLAAVAQSNFQLVKEIVLIGSNSVSRGRIPPFWPYEFNLTKDRGSTVKVFNSGIPLTVIPLNVARRLRVTSKEVRTLHGKIGRYLADNSSRWFLRNRLLKWSAAVPIWDLVATMYVIAPELFHTRRENAKIHETAWIEYGKGDRPVRIVDDFRPNEVWKRFGRLLYS